MDRMSTQIEKPETSSTLRTYHALRGMIVTGELGPSEKLKIDELRRRLHTGASPIREALSLLTSDHLVERLDHRGFRAAAISRENFWEILVLRCTLEDMALRQSLAAATLEWEETIVLAHHRMQRAQHARDHRLEELHKAFHMSLLSGASSPILRKFCSQLYDLNVRYRYLAGRSQGYESRDVRDEHEGILKAAVARDADGASERLLGHYRRTGSYLASFFDDGATPAGRHECPRGRKEGE